MNKPLFRRCRRDPEFFCRRVLGVEPWAKQAEVLRALCDHPRVAVRSGHGTGKSFIAASAALWFLYSHYPAKVVTTAPTWNQVRAILWQEIRAQHGRARVALGGSLLEEGLKLDAGSFAVGLSTDEPERFQGYHAEHLLVILDEAPGVRPEVWEGAGTLLTGRGSRVLAIGNPTRADGEFYRAFAPHSGWKCVHISCYDSPNLAGDAPRYGALVSRDWIERKKRDWGENSALFQSRVLGEFPQEEESLLIPRALLAQAAGDGEQYGGVADKNRGDAEKSRGDAEKGGGDGRKSGGQAKTSGHEVDNANNGNYCDNCKKPKNHGRPGLLAIPVAKPQEVVQDKVAKKEIANSPCGTSAPGGARPQGEGVSDQWSESLSTPRDIPAENVGTPAPPQAGLQGRQCPEEESAREGAHAPTSSVNADASSGSAQNYIQGDKEENHLCCLNANNGNYINIGKYRRIEKFCDIESSAGGFRPPLRLGVDVARFGDDATAFVLRDQREIFLSETRRGLSTTETAGRVIELARAFDLDEREIFVDDTGLGAGVTDRLREAGLDVTAVILGAGASDNVHFANVRAECFWRLRGALQAGFKIGRRDGLLAELGAIRYELSGSGAVKIERKDALRARLGGSPDSADALALTFARTEEDAPLLAVI